MPWPKKIDRSCENVMDNATLQVKGSGIGNEAQKYPIKNLCISKSGRPIEFHSMISRMYPKVLRTMHILSGTFTTGIRSTIKCHFHSNFTTCWMKFIRLKWRILYSGNSMDDVSGWTNQVKWNRSLTRRAVKGTQTRFGSNPNDEPNFSSMP